MDSCLIDQSVTTAVFSYPITSRWVKLDSLEVVPGLTAEMMDGRRSCALIGSVDATLLLDRYAVVTDFALVSHHTGAIRLWTDSRPDDVEHATVGLDQVSRTAEAVARATLVPFFGIDVIDWDRATSGAAAAIREDADALRAIETGCLSDLARAWFILSGFPLTTHLLIAPLDLVERGTEGLAPVIQSLDVALAAANERRRELRRSLVEDYGLDREQLIQFQGDQTTSLSKAARKGWFDLIRRTGRLMNLPMVSEPTVVSVRRQR